MPFTILDNDESFASNPQSIWMQTDINAIIAGIGGDGVVSGCAVTAQGSPDMTVAVAIGTINIAGAAVAVAAGNVTITAADVTNPRIDLVVVSNAGVKSVTAGTAAANPKAPDIPANSVLLAMVYVPANDTTIATNQITDKRVIAVALITGGGTLALGGFVVTAPASLTIAGLAIANVFTTVNEFDRNGITGTSTDGLVLANTTAAAVGVQQFSPRLRLTGQGWKTNATAASQTVDWLIENQPIQDAANPTTNLVIKSQVNAAGYVQRALLTSAGFFAVGGIQAPLAVLSAQAASGLNALIEYVVNGQSSVFVGQAGTASGMIVGSATGDMVLRTPNKNALFSVDAGSNAHLTLAAAAGKLTHLLSDSATAAASSAAVFAHTSSGTPAAGFGSTYEIQLKSSTTPGQSAADDTVTWVVATHASRTARRVYNIYDFNGAREALRIEASGTAPMIGFMGANAAVRQTGGAATASAAWTATEQAMLQKIYDAGRTFGFLT